MNAPWSLCGGCHRGWGHSLLPAATVCLEKETVGVGLWETQCWGQWCQGKGPSVLVSGREDFRNLLTLISRGLYIWLPPRLSP